MSNQSNYRFGTPLHLHTAACKIKLGNNLLTLERRIAVRCQFRRKNCRQRQSPHGRKSSNDHQIALSVTIRHGNRIGEKITARFIVGTSILRRMPKTSDGKDLSPAGFRLVVDYNEVLKRGGDKCHIALHALPAGVRSAKPATEWVDYLVAQR